MKHAAIWVAVVAAFACSPASAHMMSCSGDMSKMTNMIGAMPDGPHKWQMNKHLAMLNAAMARDGSHGCSMTMKQMMGGSKPDMRMHMQMGKMGKMGMMKSGM